LITVFNVLRPQIKRPFCILIEDSCFLYLKQFPYEVPMPVELSTAGTGSLSKIVKSLEITL